MGAGGSLSSGAYDEDEQSGLNPGQPHRRPVTRYLLFTMIQIFVTVGIWEIIRELVTYQYASMLHRIAIYTVITLLGVIVILLVYDENLDSAVN